jgi:cytochrome P450
MLLVVGELLMLDNGPLDLRESFSVREPDVVANLYSYYAMFRRLAPVHWDERLKAWICTDYQTCQHVLRSTDLFTTDCRRLGIDIPDVMHSLQSLDPPEHAPVRQLVASAFHAQDMAEFEQRLRAIVREGIEGLPTDRTVDLTTELIGPIALRAICDYLGAPAPELSWFMEVSDRLVLGMDGGYVPEAVPGAMRAREELSELASEWVEAGVGEGLVGWLVDAHNKESISRSLLVNTIRVTFHAGHSSSSRLMENAMLACLQDPDVRSALRAISGTDAMRTATDELIRFDGPVQAVGRFCAVDTRLRDRQIRRGDVVTVMLGAANHDPDVFDQPDRLELDRKPNPHLGFGRGIHSCLGAGMARLETRVLLEELLEAYPHVSLADSPTRRVSGTLRGVFSLPVELVRASFS